MKYLPAKNDVASVPLAYFRILTNRFDIALSRASDAPMSNAFFFGYGSLVNVHTHTYGETAKAQLTGWERVWRTTTLREVPFLTVRPAKATSIDGLIAHVPGNDWAQLDAREYGYDRLNPPVLHDKGDGLDIATYVVPDRLIAPGQKGAILLSYLDVVVQGFLAEFGEAGVRRFFDTTSGWDHPIDNDRKDPKYPRHQTLSSDERDLVTSELARIGHRI